MTSDNNPIQPFLDAQGFVVLDGGLATELEFAGQNLDDSLWSARLIKESPNSIAAVHLRYLDAGADCVISASYQATIPGFVNRGSSVTEAEETIRESVRLAIKARDQFWETTTFEANRLKPLVAASVGPYGAYLANGAEFTGDYDLDEKELVTFHRRRWEILASSGADLLACETIPSLAEARALAALIPETPGVHAWFSFSCRDGEHISDGTPIAQCVEELAPIPEVIAVGVNCTAPQHISSLVEVIRSNTKKLIIVYPNLGEVYEPARKTWSPISRPENFAGDGRRWYLAGARLIGGCCRTRPEDIRRLRQQLLKSVVRGNHEHTF